MLEIAGLYVYSYLVGAVPTAYLLARFSSGIDIRQYGSGNVGGSNLAQHAGRHWVVLLLIFDILIKGATPILVGVYVTGLDWASFWLMAAPVLSAIGHNWSPFMRFQGGRGISVVAGALLSVDWLALALCLAVVGAGKKFTGSSALWVLACLAALPFWALLFGNPAWVPGEGQASSIFALFAALLAVTVLKRLLGNALVWPQRGARRKVLFNRLFHDRDVDQREDWVHRAPVLSES